MNVLLVEDSMAIVSALEYTFQSQGYIFQAKTSLYEAKKYLEEKMPDIMILDISLPDGNGLCFYENCSYAKQIPTIFLTAEDDEETIVKGLNLGADDYITKPFSTKELMARVNRVLVRNRKDSVIRVQDISFDMDKMLVKKGDSLVSLTSLEMKLLHLLFLNLNKVVSRNSILDKIWEWTGNDVDDHTITVYMKRIREKVGTEIITTVKGIGYRVDQHEK